MIKVVSFKICPFVQRVTALLEAKRLSYEIEYISLSNKPQWFIDIAPNAQVPVLITDSGVVLFESDAIVEYLDEISDPLESNNSPEQRAIDRAWSYMATKNYLVQCGAMRSADEESFKQRSENLRLFFAKVEKALGEGPFFKGEAFSNVDVAWLPLLHRAHIIFEYTGYDFLSSFPKVQAWQKAILETGIAEKSVSDDFEGAFVDFYLSDKTYLGVGRSCRGELGVKSAEDSCC